MYDKDEEVIKREKDLLETGNISYQFLNSMLIEYKEKLVNISNLEKQYTNDLNDNSKHNLERQRTKIYNSNFFTPVIIPSNGNNTESFDVNNTKIQVDDIKNEKHELNKKIHSMQNTMECINGFIELMNYNNSKYINIKEIGINILETQEKERQRIAMDLHDTAVQNLTGLIHKIELCTKLIDMDTVRTKLELNALSNIIRLVINDMRNTIYNLKPMSLDDLGLVFTVDRYAKNIMDNNNIIVKLKYNLENIKLDSIIDLTLFRVVQEACQNILKHASATQIDIDLIYNEKDIIVTIKDNGIGFDVDKVINQSDNRKTNFGISIMKERITLLCGNLNIQSNKNKGTVITVYVPIK